MYCLFKYLHLLIFAFYGSAILHLCIFASFNFLILRLRRIASFISFVTKRKKRIKERFAVCTSSAKNRSRFPKARKLASLKQPALFNGKRSRFSSRYRCEDGIPHTTSLRSFIYLRPHFWSVKKLRSVFGKEGCTAKSPKEMSCGPPKNVSKF